MSFHVVLQHRRTTRRVLSLLDQCQDLVVLDAGDRIEIRVGRGADQPATLEISSQGPTPKGSSCSQANPCTVVFSEDDVSDLTPGDYNVDVVVIDSSDNDRELPVATGVATVVECVS